MSTDQLIKDALYAAATASDVLVPGSGKHYRSFADGRYQACKHCACYTANVQPCCYCNNEDCKFDTDTDFSPAELAEMEEK